MLFRSLYVILEGSVQIYKGKGSVSVLGRGSFFGEISLLGDAVAATASVATREGCTLLLVSAEALRGWFKKHPPGELVFYRHLAVELCRRLYLTTEKVSG